MLSNKRPLALLLCLSLLLILGGCSLGGTDETTLPTETVPETTAPIDGGAVYSGACETLFSASDIAVHYTYDQRRTVAGETFTENRTGTASYDNYGSNTLEALVSETLTYGGYSAQYIESFLSGDAYCRVSNTNFQCPMTAAEFTARQIPAQLLDSGLYGSIAAETVEDTTVITFKNAACLESWVTGAADAQLTAASGTATVDATGKLSAATYHAEYTLNTTAYVLDVSITLETPEKLSLSAQQPVYPMDCPQLSDLDIPRYLLRVVGDVYGSGAVSASYTDTLISAAFSSIRTQTGNYIASGSGDSLDAEISTQVTLTDFAGSSTSNSQQITFRDGQYTNTINGSEVTTDGSVTAEQVRTNVEDSILSAMLTLDAITSGELTDTGDFLCIRFTATDSYTSTLCANIYTLFGINLDSFAQSYTTDSAGSYLTIDKYSALPTAMGISLSRSHVIDNVSYTLTYQKDQAIQLPAAAENAPVQTATPLLYRVTGEDGQTMWLMGTVDCGADYNLPQAVLDALSEADAFALEYDLNAFDAALLTDASLQTQLITAYYYGEGTVAEHISPELYDSAYPLLLATGCNSSTAGAMKAIIWHSLIEELFLQRSYTLSTEHDTDLKLLELAAAQHKTIYEMESGISQVNILTGFSDSLQAAMLERLIGQGMTAFCQEQQTLFTLWCKGDEAALTTFCAMDASGLTEEQQALFDEYYKAMYTDRHSAMLKAMKGYLSGGETVFCAIGVKHLVGEDGLVQALRDAGYTVETVTY